ncbi:hypothetical protein HPP92_009081 [Vanilla planifolia]|uniref:Protein kinase domain-containing protein n=1 Tax=Vanilla planifolia TaxID=51239 RepID=A0A835V4D2_VANPL|nr:hypothetical protein HPP92_009081 [Vanilla planifolia]
MEWRRGEIAASLLLICSLNPMSLSAQVTSKLPSEEIEALKRIAAAINKTNWDFNVDPCSQEASWVTHNAANGFENSVWCNNCTADGSICHVTSIVLKAQNLVGTLPPEMASLPFLQEIDLTRNFLNGTIPVEWAALPLVNFSLLGNKVSGQIPLWIGNKTALKNLVLEANQFTGPLPKELGNLQSLEKMQFSANAFSGDLPDTFANLTSLMYFDIQASGLEGPIPAAFSQLANLNDLRISDVVGNSDFPTLARMEQLQFLTLRNCGITGVIPDFLESFLNLKAALLVSGMPNEFLCIILLGRKLWGFPRFAGDCASGHRKSHAGTTLEQKSDLTYLCSQMMLQLQEVYDPNKINVKVKVVSGSPSGVVAAESKRANASWVVLDKQLKHEEKRCMEDLQCNIVVMKRSQPKVLRLNLVGSPEAKYRAEAKLPEPCILPQLDVSREDVKKDIKCPQTSILGPTVTPSSSPEIETSFTSTDPGTSSLSSSGPGTSPFSISEANGSLKKSEKLAAKESRNLDVTSSDSDCDNGSPSVAREFLPWMAGLSSGGLFLSKHVEKISDKLYDSRISKAKSLLEKYSKPDWRAGNSSMNLSSDWDFRGTVRDNVPIRRNSPSGPPPLCTICQHKAPVFGKPPRLFSYSELEFATSGFSQANFLAEGGFGSVHRGVLPDGQAIAVKQHKLASSQGDHEFCAEVEVLSCAQHRNVVMLIGFCVEDRRRLLVYEYICNGSLDSHLYGHNQEPLEWSARQKVAVGAARGLRYLHEECRVGCIVHRDMRPNNILITHDFEPLVGDFGLARWQPDGDLGVETRVIGTFGYLAPEYAQSGQITDKADVYSFGVVLIELVTGRKAVDINRPKGQQCLTEWARPLLEEYAIEELIDPCLGGQYLEQEAYCMLHAASLCIRRDPHVRPKMSQVLRILEGNFFMESGWIGSQGSDDVGCRSGRFWSDERRCHSSRIQHARSNSFGGDQSYDSLRLEWEREGSRRR